mgnify:CR=1 FL=1
MTVGNRLYNSAYTGDNLQRIAFPMGGIGAGMICLEGAGALSHVSLRHRPQIFNEPMVFSAVHVRQGDRAIARVLEGPVPEWKIYFPWPDHDGAGCGAPGKTYGLPRFAEASFEARFPFGTVHLQDQKLPLDVRLTGWSPFIPANADDSSLPVAALEYTLRNTTNAPIEGVWSFHARNFMFTRRPGRPKEDQPRQGVRRTQDGFVLFQEGTEDEPHLAGAFAAAADAPNTAVNCRWFRGAWFDPQTIVWKTIAEGAVINTDPYDSGGPSPGGSLYVPFSLQPGTQTTIRLRLSWYVPVSDLRIGKGADDEAQTQSATAGATPLRRETYCPWYAARFDSIDSVDAYWRSNYDRLLQQTRTFTDCFYDTTLPPEVIEAVATNLTILKSPTTLRQADGRLWLWEGCRDDAGSCHGSCTHVWNYAQAIAHLFPDLERTLRETEFFENQDDRGHQNFRATLPIRRNVNDFHAAADGQLGGILKVHRDWRISGDTQWLKRLWPRVRQSLDYCIATWDPDEQGKLTEPHHNTYDIEFWGADGMCTSFYAAALLAAVRMGQALGEDVQRYEVLYQKARAALEGELFNGEYFIQKVQWTGLHAPDPVTAARNAWNVEYSDEAKALLQAEGPKYQYGNGCLADGILGAWIGEMCGVGGVVDPAKVRTHLQSIVRYNFREDLSDHANPQRPTYALGREAGLLLCTWRKGGQLSLPFPYTNEVWTGIEYSVASHLMLMGRVEEALKLVRAARSRYDGRIRNPFAEYECGHWYGRALSSYGLLQGLTGQRYDALTRTLYLKPQIQGDWRAFLSTATGFGTIGMRDGKPFIEVRYGQIPVDRIELEPRMNADERR